MLSKVRIVGSGLIGTSIALGLVQRGISVEMVDSDPSAQSLAADLVGHQRVENPDLVVLALPTSALNSVIEMEISLNPASTFIDVGSVKSEVEREVQRFSGLSTRFLPSHPMAGREIGGAASARADLFEGRTWVISPALELTPGSKALAVEMITALGATPCELDAQDHDEAVAKISHLPQIVASLVAKQLKGTAPHWMELSGQGLRDTTRIAGSDENLWKEIIFSNRVHIQQLLINLQSDLSQFISALDNPDEIAEILAQGREGRSLIPGKHGGKAREYSYLPIVIEDKPGQLAELFQECSRMNANIEDLSIEHSPGQLSALITLSLSNDDAVKLSAHLASIGWNVHPIRK